MRARPRCFRRVTSAAHFLPAQLPIVFIRMTLNASISDCLVIAESLCADADASFIFHRFRLNRGFACSAVAVDQDQIIGHWCCPQLSRTHCGNLSLLLPTSIHSAKSTNCCAREIDTSRRKAIFLNVNPRRRRNSACSIRANLYCSISCTQFPFFIGSFFHAVSQSSPTALPSGVSPALCAPIAPSMATIRSHNAWPVNSRSRGRWFIVTGQSSNVLQRQ